MLKTKNYIVRSGAILSSSSLTVAINTFWDTVFKGLLATNPEVQLFILVKVHFEDKSKGIKTIAHGRRVGFKDRAVFLNYLQNRIGLLDESYSIDTIESISICYKELRGVVSDNTLQLIDPVYEVKTHNYNSYKLPLSMEPLKYGEVIATTNHSDYVRYAVIDSSNRIIVIDVYADKNIVTIKGPTNLTWTDTKISDSVFVRELSQNKLYILDGEIVVKSKQLKGKPFYLNKVDKVLNNDRVITFDIETIQHSYVGENGVTQNCHLPYLICGYNGEN